jgi:uncharacterized membrane protein YcaP (DUF421 family)
MQWVQQLFGEGNDLTVLQMSCRALIIFMITLLLIRISGRRSFGMRTPLDNIVTLLLGALLSRAVSGSSPFVPVIAASFVLTVAHRMVCYSVVHNKRLARLIQGRKIILFSNGQFNQSNMDSALVSREDIAQGMRSTLQTEHLSETEQIFMERNGEITAIKKETC